MDSGLKALTLFVALGAFVSLEPQDARAQDKLLAQPPREIEFRLKGDVATSPIEPRQLGTSIDLMMTMRDVTLDRLGPVRTYTLGAWGRWVKQPKWSLSWRIGSEEERAPGPAEVLPDTSAEPALPHDATAPTILKDRAWMSRFGIQPSFDTTGFGLRSDGFDSVFLLPPTKPVVDWRCRRKPTLVMRSGSESETFHFVRCDGSVAPDALDKLSILARPPNVARPGDTLPDEPDPTAWKERREWIDGVRLMHPRLLWALQQLSDAFPRKAILLHSGYRPNAEINDATGHRSQHADGRALDIAIYKVSNEDLFRFCNKLRGVGCGFYPNNKFIHIDVRKAEAGEAFFVDTSAPGDPAVYVRDYPGILREGKLVKP